MKKPLTGQQLLDLLKKRSEKELSKPVLIYDDTVGDYEGQVNDFIVMEGEIVIVHGNNPETK